MKTNSLRGNLQSDLKKAQETELHKLVELSMRAAEWTCPTTCSSATVTRVQVCAAFGTPNCLWKG